MTSPNQPKCAHCIYSMHRDDKTMWCTLMRPVIVKRDYSCNEFQREPGADDE